MHVLQHMVWPCWWHLGLFISWAVVNQHCCTLSRWHLARLSLLAAYVRNFDSCGLENLWVLNATFSFVHIFCASVSKYYIVINWQIILSLILKFLLKNSVVTIWEWQVLVMSVSLSRQYNNAFLPLALLSVARPLTLQTQNHLGCSIYKFTTHCWKFNI